VVKLRSSDFSGMVIVLNISIQLHYAPLFRGGLSNARKNSTIDAVKFLYLQNSIYFGWFSTFYIAVVEI
jgi:hypothetical protein